MNTLNISFNLKKRINSLAKHVVEKLLAENRSFGGDLLRDFN